MLNKNDPLISVVQEVMKRNQLERDAAKLVNEKFGVQDRKAMPHEKLGAWDAAYKQVLSEGLHPNQQPLDVHEPEKDKLTKHDFKMLRAKKKTMEEENAPKTDPYAEGQASSISTVAIPKKEVTPADQSALKKKIMSIKEAKSNAYAIGMAAVKKSTGDEPPMEKKNVMKAHKIAKKIIAKKKMNEGFNNRHGLSVTASAEKQAVAALNEDDIDSYENRMTAGLGQQYTPYGGGRFGGGAAKTGSIRPRPVRIDNPRIKNTRTGEVSTGTSGPKKRRRLVLKQKQPSAAQQGTMQGQIAKMRQQSGDVAPVRMGMNAADKAKLRIDQAKRSYRTTVQNRPPSQTPSQNIPKPNPQGQGSALPPPKTTSPVIRRGGLSTSRIIKNVAGSAAAGAAVGGAGIAAMSYLNDLGNKPPPAEAKPKGKIYTDRVPEEKPKAQEIPQRKLDTPTRKVTDTEIMNAPQYKQAVKAVGGEASARKIQPGTNVSGIGTVAKGETIWSKVKSQLEKQPAPAPKGFERGNTKGGAGR